MIYKSKADLDRNSLCPTSEQRIMEAEKRFKCTIMIVYNGPDQTYSDLVLLMEGYTY